MPRITFAKGQFVAHDLPLGDRKGWVDAESTLGACYTRDPRVVARLRQFCDAQARKRIDHAFIKIEPWSRPLLHPAHLTPRAYQKYAASFALSRTPASYLAMDPGTGKTPTAALVHLALRGASLYISPPSIVETVAAILSEWCGEESTVAVYPEPPGDTRPLWVLPDTLLHTPKLRALVTQFLSRFRKEGPVTLFVDEAHRFSDFEARRTRALLQGLVPAFSRTVYLSGTPMTSRPIELFPIVSTSAPSTIGFRDELEYGLRYCGAYQDDRGRWVLQGSANLPELAHALHGSFMHRVRKADVLPELPALTEQLVFLGGALPPTMADLDAQILRAHSPEDVAELAVKNLRGLNPDAKLQLSTYRKELGLLKVKAAAQFIKDVLDDGDEALLVFALHREVIAQLAKQLAQYKPLLITGQTPMDERHRIEKMFQATKGRRLMMGNLNAMGLGFTLTKATRVILVEYSWVPAENRQAIDRAHRIGQKDHVLAQYLAFRNSLDRKVLEVNFGKGRITAHV